MRAAFTPLPPRPRHPRPPLPAPLPPVPKTLDQLREIQAERRLREERDLKRAATLLELHKHKGIPYDPAADGFVFSKDQIEAHAQRLIRLNEARHFEHALFHMQPPATNH